MKHPKRIQEIIDNQGKIMEEVKIFILQTEIDIGKRDREQMEELRKMLGC